MGVVAAAKETGRGGPSEHSRMLSTSIRVVIVVVIEIWRLGPFGKGIPSKR